MDAKPAKPSFLKTYGPPSLAALAFPAALGVAFFWFLSRMDIATGADAEAAYSFHHSLVEAVEKSGVRVPDQTIFARPRPGRRGIIYVMPGYPENELGTIRTAFQRLNTIGSFQLVEPPSH